jgi:site-specific DNA-methyltransferase (adenine-specific)
VPYKTIRDRKSQRPHPATFPVKIPEMCIRLHGVGKTRRVLDPFAGIGHTGVACAELGVDFVGFEIDPDYFQQARQVIDRSLRLL